MKTYSMRHKDRTARYSERHAYDQFEKTLGKLIGWQLAVGIILIVSLAIAMHLDYAMLVRGGF